MSAIKITEVFIGRINNSLERSLQNLTTTCMQQTLDGLSYACAHQLTISSKGKESLSLSPDQAPQAPLLWDSDTAQLSSVICRPKATRMKLSLPNVRATASETGKLCLLNVTLKEWGKESEGILFLKGRKQL